MDGWVAVVSNGWMDGLLGFKVFSSSYSLPFISAPCAPNQFRCESGQCIVGNPKCDDHKNCSDGSDEEGCSK